MRRERSIFEAFLTKIKPTIFCLVSKALPLPRLALAFPTGQCGVRLYHRNDLADSSWFFPVPSASTPGETGLKDSWVFFFFNWLLFALFSAQERCSTHSLLFYFFSRFPFCLYINIVAITPLRHIPNSNIKIW